MGEERKEVVVICEAGGEVNPQPLKGSLGKVRLIENC